MTSDEDMLGLRYDFTLRDGDDDSEAAVQAHWGARNVRHLDNLKNYRVQMDNVWPQASFLRNGNAYVLYLYADHLR